LIFILNLENERRWFWAFPQIEGVPPCPRGGHSATLIGASILYFGVSHKLIFKLILGTLLWRKEIRLHLFE
jgi:hypothetical protein